MIAGREMDALVAERVMGCKVGKFKFSRYNEDFICECRLANYHSEENGRLNHYSTDIASAWLVVEKLNLLTADGWMIFKNENGKWVAGQTDYGGMHEIHTGENAPQVICLAALENLKVIVWCRAREEWIIDTSAGDKHTSKESHK